jgi:hypothetical protein
MTDVPVAALVAATAAVAWSRGTRRWRMPALILCAAAAGLTKPSAFPSLCGLAASRLIGDRARLRERILRDAVPIAGGVVLALTWHAYQAHALGTSLIELLRTGTAGYYVELSGHLRAGALLRADWLGSRLAVLVVFSLGYAVSRIAGVGHGRAAAVSAPLALAGAWLGPWTASGGASVWVGPLASSATAITTLALAGPLWLAADCPEAARPSREELARLVVWLAPPLVAWAVITPYTTRLLSPAWPPLILLLLLVVASALAPRRRPVGPLVLSVALVGLALGNVRNLDRGWGRAICRPCSPRASSPGPSSVSSGVPCRRRPRSSSPSWAPTAGCSRAMGDSASSSRDGRRATIRGAALSSAGTRCSCC